jgi:hypothetical protein
VSAAAGTALWVLVLLRLLRRRPLLVRGATDSDTRLGVQTCHTLRDTLETAHIKMYQTRDIVQGMLQQPGCHTLTGQIGLGSQHTEQHMVAFQECCSMQASSITRLQSSTQITPNALPRV